MIRAIIIDDEPMAIESLELILKKKCKDLVQVVASSLSPIEGLKLIGDLHPDLVFLDIEMPGMSGIDLLRSIPNPHFRVVFVTAFDAYAIEALRLCAFDYLLKPVETAEIEKLISRFRIVDASEGNNIAGQLQNLEKIIQKGYQQKEQKIGIGMAEKILFIDIPDIVYLEASGVYTNIFLQDGRKLIASKPLGDFEAQLNAKGFFRIHHSFLINLSFIKEFQRFDGGQVVMQNNTRLDVSHRRRKGFMDAINDLLV